MLFLERDSHFRPRAQAEVEFFNLHLSCEAGERQLLGKSIERLAPRITCTPQDKGLQIPTLGSGSRAVTPRILGHENSIVLTHQVGSLNGHPPGRRLALFAHHR